MIWRTPVEERGGTGCRTWTEVPCAILLVDVTDGGLVHADGWGSLAAPARSPRERSCPAGATLPERFQAKLEQLARFGFTGRGGVLAAVRPSVSPRAATVPLRPVSPLPMRGAVWR